MDLQLAVLPGLCTLGFGVLAGVAIPISAIRAALQKYRSQMIWLILGLMLGSLYATASLATPRPALSMATFQPVGFVLGATVLLALESARMMMERKEQPGVPIVKGEKIGMNLDWIILHGLRVLTTCPLLDFWMPRITALGNSGIVWVVAAIVLLCTKKYRRYGVMLLVGLAAALLLGNLALKNLFARPRPCWLDESVPLLIARPSDYSFPSGHTMAGAIGATILTAADRRFGWAAIPLAVLIAFSRLYLYVHFPSDVLGGAVLGVGIGLLMLYGERWIAGRCKHRPLQ